MILHLVGLLSDRIGRKPVFAIGSIAFMFFSYPLFLWLQHGDFFTLLCVQICFAIFTCFVFAPIPVTLAELMPTEVRYTAMSLPLNIGSAVYGGTAPLIVTYLIHVTASPLAPSFYLILGAVVLLFSLLGLAKEYRLDSSPFSKGVRG